MGIEDTEQTKGIMTEEYEARYVEATWRRGQGPEMFVGRAGRVAPAHGNFANELAATGARCHDAVRFACYAATWEGGQDDEFVASAQASREFDMSRSPLARIAVGTFVAEGIVIETVVTAVVDQVKHLPTASGGD